MPNDEQTDLDLSEVGRRATKGSEWDLNQVEGILHEIDRQHESAEDSRDENIELLLDRIDALEEELSDYRQLEKENTKLKERLENFKHTPPLVAYLIIGLGAMISATGYVVSNDLVFAIGGLGIIAIGLAATGEAKLKGARKQ